ncbi:hypothetical protein J6590_034668 [Homalodisca vitripennis]|nr:hypothetical protein J6590_034668 [Homalodisca vitripennis]
MDEHTQKQPQSLDEQQVQELSVAVRQSHQLINGVCRLENYRRRINTCTADPGPALILAPILTGEMRVNTATEARELSLSRIEYNSIWRVPAARRGGHSLVPANGASANTGFRPGISHLPAQLTLKNGRFVFTFSFD